MVSPIVTLRARLLWYCIPGTPYSGLLRLANAVIVIYSLDMVRSASSVLYL